MKPDRKVIFTIISTKTNKTALKYIEKTQKTSTLDDRTWNKMIDLSDDRKSIFNHLQSSQQNETETNKTALKYTTKKEKTPTFG